MEGSSQQQQQQQQQAPSVMIRNMKKEAPEEMTTTSATTTVVAAASVQTPPRDSGGLLPSQMPSTVAAATASTTTSTTGTSGKVLTPRRSSNFYEELKIRDGPLYTLNAPSRNVSSEYLLSYTTTNGPTAGGVDEAAAAAAADVPVGDTHGDDEGHNDPRTSSSSSSRRRSSSSPNFVVDGVDIERQKSSSNVDDTHSIAVGNAAVVNTSLDSSSTSHPMGTSDGGTRLSVSDKQHLQYQELAPQQPQPQYYYRNPLPAETTALLIVDVQPEYWSNCPAVRKDFPNFPQHLAQTIEICRQRRAKIIWVRADYRYSHSPWLLQFERIRGPRNLGEVPCDPSSPSFTSWEDFARPQGGEVIIAKSSWSSTTNTALMDILRTAGIDTVLVCGLITSVCVQHSAFGIFEAGYRTLLVTDACADRGRARHEAALALYGDYMYELVTSEDLECETTGLIQAEPVWLTLDAKTRMVRANSFPKQAETASVSSSTEPCSTSMSSKSKLRPPPPPPVVHHLPHRDSTMRKPESTSHDKDKNQQQHLPDGSSSPSSSSLSSSLILGAPTTPMTADQNNHNHIDDVTTPNNNNYKQQKRVLTHSGSTNSTTTTVCSSSSNSSTSDEEEVESSSSGSSSNSSDSTNTNGSDGVAPVNGKYSSDPSATERCGIII